jgi:hypothetical protein
VSQSTIKRWTKDQRREEKEEKQAAAWDLWLDCWRYREIALAVLQDEEKKSTVERWVSQKRQMPEMGQPHASLQTFDIWDFAKLDPTAGSAIFGRMPAQIVENLLWLYTDVGSIIVDPFAASSTRIWWPAHGVTVDGEERVTRKTDKHAPACCCQHYKSACRPPQKPRSLRLTFLPRASAAQMADSTISAVTGNQVE